MHSFLPLCGLAVCLFALQASADPALTIYNEDFAVVRDNVPLDLKAGMTDVRFSGVTAHLEPNSVVLRDPAGKVPFRVVEQNYRFDPVSRALLLSRFEGKTIPFSVEKPGLPTEIVQGKIIRGGYVAPDASDDRNSHGGGDMGEPGSGTGPIVEVNGKLIFALPGEPLFPSLGDDTLLLPTLDWKIYSQDAAKLDAELAYVTDNMSWQADYTVIAPEDSDDLDLVGLVTITNRSGKTFEHAKIKLMAGQVNKKPDEDNKSVERVVITGSNIPQPFDGPPAVKVKSFDEYHLYSLPLPTTLHDQETKQIEFTRAAHVPGSRVYVYDGFKPDEARTYDTAMESIRGEASYGTGMTDKVHVLREFQNTAANGLGIALPKGRLRFYRRDDDGQLEFTGENNIDHTPSDETLRLYSGDAFDLVGSRRRVDFKYDEEGKHADETFEIKLRNHKKEAVEVRVVEHLYRWTNWNLVKPLPAWNKLDTQTMETRVGLKPGEEKTLGYTVHYSWASDNKPGGH